MLSGANAFRISGYKLKPEDRMQQCYMPCGRRNNNSPATPIRQPALLGDEEDMQEIAAAWRKIQKFAKELA
jgi:hypothetical protein